MRWSILSLLLLFFLLGCESRVETHDIKYRIQRLSNGPVTYRVVYASGGDATLQQGPIEDQLWDSPVVQDVDNGTELLITMEVISGNGQFEVTIFRGKGEWEVETANVDPNRTYTLSKIL
ncbi:MAG: hypothetical protein ACFB10_18135 [Salibacteraceae bacterium]